MKKSIFILAGIIALSAAAITTATYASTTSN